MHSRHVVNFGLLFSFVTLAVTGVLAYFLPFDSLTTRLHIFFGATTVIFVFYHLWQKYQYFYNTLSRLTRGLANIIILLLTLWLLFFTLSYQNLFPSNLLMELSYEGQNRREILRHSNFTASQEAEKTLTTVRVSGENNLTALKQLALAIEVHFSQPSENKPAIAIWAESTNGSLIETLYLSPELAYSDSPTWYGNVVPRHHILPVWRNRYTLLSGLNTAGEIDGTTGATDNHQFSLENVLAYNADEYVLFLEINAPYDTDKKWPDPLLGQPSVLYSAYMSHQQKKRYALLELTGHGGSADFSGDIQYDLSDLSSATELIEVIIASGRKIQNAEPVPK